MLPGVELARKRRIHHHGGHRLEPLASSRASSPAGPSPRAELLRSPTSTADSALLARRRLEEKLHRFGVGPVPPAPSTTTTTTTTFFSWRNPVGDEHRVEPPRRSAPATRVTAAKTAASAARTKKPLRAAAAVMERVDSGTDECAVCLDGLRGGEGRPVLSLPCSHRYHWECLRPWLAGHRNCPSCRTPVP